MLQPLRYQQTATPLLPQHGNRRPLAQQDVSIDPDSFWGSRQQLNATVMLDHEWQWMNREGWIDNFRAAAAGTLPAARRGREFTDSDVYKLLEAMLWEHGRLPNGLLQTRITELTAVITTAQDADGYLNTAFGRPGQPPRYSDLEWGHELYSYGHLLQAAVAELRTSGAGGVTAVARRAADHVVATFGRDGLRGLCGHPEIELGLIELARATGDERYRDQARIFLDRRGHGTLDSSRIGPEYWQDDVPIQHAHALRGHAVRAAYLAAAATDVAVDDTDAATLTSLHQQWDHTISRRTYLTGGMGSRHEDEAFGADFELPSEHAYSETCASVAALMWTWRLLLHSGDSRYGDFAERLLQNVIATAVAPDGQAFFYSNTLHQRQTTRPQRPDRASLRASSSMRAPWFEVSCCPPNISRTLATLASYIGWSEDSGVTLSLLAPMQVRPTLPDGTVTDITLTTTYPNDGRVQLAVRAASRPYDLTVRIPAWASGATLQRYGRVVEVQPGWLTISRLGLTDEMIALELPMRAQVVFGDPRVDSARAAVAIERGPTVHCLESIDINGLHVDDIVVDPSSVHTDGGEVRIRGWSAPPAPKPWSHTVSHTDNRRALDTPLVPYNAWGTRGPSTMRVWLRTE